MVLDDRCSAGVSMQTSHAGESAALAPPEFLRLQYSTDPPSSANNSREGTPDQAAVEVTQPAQHTMQVCILQSWFLSAQACNFLQLVAHWRRCDSPDLQSAM